MIQYETTAAWHREQAADFRNYFAERIRELRERDSEREKFISIAIDQLKRFVALPMPPLQTVAEIASEIASARLGIPVQTVVEIPRGQHVDKLGFAAIPKSQHRVHVRFQDCAHRVAAVTAHECRHRFQILNDKFWEKQSTGETERDADQYAEKFVQEFDLRRRCACYRRRG